MRPELEKRGVFFRAVMFVILVFVLAFALVLMREAAVPPRVGAVEFCLKPP